jgi:hypothetical protein
MLPSLGWLINIAMDPLLIVVVYARLDIDSAGNWTPLRLLLFEDIPTKLFLSVVCSETSALIATIELIIENI